VVGIAEDAVQSSLLPDDARLRYYMPMEQYNGDRNAYLLLRMRGEAAGQEEGVRRALQPLMPGESYVTVRAMSDLVDGRRRSWEVGATMFAAFGVLALVVAAVGLYGVITYNVAQRMHELGVRVALGARPRDLARLVVGQGLSFALAGVALGGVVALLVAPQVQPLLFEQPARDPVIYAAVSTVLLVVAVLASMAPARRASRADPNVVLRSE
jgi:ABC-type antimicrobial peptide transport system permease subunit